MNNRKEAINSLKEIRFLILEDDSILWDSLPEKIKKEKIEEYKQSIDFLIDFIDELNNSLWICKPVFDCEGE